MKAAQFHQRLMAKGIDFFLVLYVARNEHAFWIILGILYLLISDGFFQGQSLGKRIVGLKTIYFEPKTREYLNVSFAQSAIRNCVFAGILLLSIIPWLGFVFGILGMILILLEVYFMYTDPEQMRIGDIYARTKVVQTQIS